MRIELENAAWLLQKMGVKGKLSQESIAAMLEPKGVTYYTIGKGKGGRIMVTKEVADEIKGMTFGVEKPERKKKEPKVKEVAGGVREIRVEVPVEKIVERIDPAWKAEIEDLVLKQEGRIDELHKATLYMVEVYQKLRGEVDESARSRLPDLPSLPPRYRWRVTVAGGRPSMFERLRDQFKDINFSFFSADMNINQDKTSMPRADLVIAMTDHVSHRLMDAINREYGRSNVRSISGGVGGAEAVISLWKQEKERQVEAEKQANVQAH